MQMRFMSTLYEKTNMEIKIPKNLVSHRNICLKNLHYYSYAILCSFQTISSQLQYAPAYRNGTCA